MHVRVARIPATPFEIDLERKYFIERDNFARGDFEALTNDFKGGALVDDEFVAADIQFSIVVTVDIEDLAPRSAPTRF